MVRYTQLVNLEQRGVWYRHPDTVFRDFSGAQPPSKLFFSLTKNCNLRCDHCARSLGFTQTGMASEGLLDYVLEDLMPDLESVQIGGLDLGEQLTSPMIGRFLQAMVAHPRVNLEILTNLTVLDAELALLIAESCHDLYVSLEGVGPAYERVRHFPWKTLEHNLGLIDSARRHVTGSGLTIHALVTCFYDNLDSLLSILDLRSLGVDQFRFRRFVPVIEDQNDQFLGHHMSSSNRVFDRIAAEASRRGLDVVVPPPFEINALSGTKPGERCLSSRPQRGPMSTNSPIPEGLSENKVELDRPAHCHLPFEAVAIRADGRVGTCCKEHNLGAVDQSNPDIHPIWRGDRWQTLRRSMIEGELDEVCRTCKARAEFARR